MNPATDRSNADLEARARRRVDAKAGLLTHATVFVLVNLGLFALDVHGGGRGWSALPLFGWGIGLAIHAAAVLFSLRGDGLRQRWLKREIEALRRDEQR